MSTPTTKKGRVITLDVKRRIIDASVGKKSEELEKQFNIPASTIRNILSSKETIRKAVDEGGKAKRIHIKSAKHEDLEKALLQWFKAAKSENIDILGEILKQGSQTSLFIRFVLILGHQILHILIVLIYKICPYFGTASLF